MLDGIEIDRAAVNDRALVERLNIKLPFSPTDGSVCYDQPLVPIDYKGMSIHGKPRGQEPGYYWIRLRGSLIKVANDGLHNEDAKDPFELLYALDDLITHLRINAFQTPINGLELSLTVQAMAPHQICSNLVSYLKHRPNMKGITRHDYKLPYTEVENAQHKLKLYAPSVGALRVEIQVSKMQFLAAARPKMLAHLVEPVYAALWKERMLSAFAKIIWKCPHLNPDSLPSADRDLYLRGQVHDYWQVKRKQYDSHTEFKRVEKKRSRERPVFDEIVRRHWLHEPPAEIERRMRKQLDRYGDLMRSSLYRTLLDICLERWQYVGNLPDCNRLPNRLKLPPLSEIYPLYLCRFPTPPSLHRNQFSLWSPTTDFSGSQFHQRAALPEVVNAKPVQSLGRDETLPESVEKDRKKWVRNWYGSEMRRVEKQANAACGMLYSPDTFWAMLSAKARVAMAVYGRELS